jgi:glycolate oxidase
MEIMDRLAMDAAEAAVKAGYPAEAQGLLIVELEGPSEEVEAETPKLMEVIQASGAYEVRIAQNETERMKIWKGRKGAFSAVGRLSPDYVVQDGVVPRTKLGEALAEIERLSRHYELRVANVFHAGDGNLHPLILYNGTIAGEFDKAEALAGDILRLCVDLGGAVTGEHGIGVEKLAYLPYMYGESDMRLMTELREAIDSKSIANRGKMLPTNQAPALTMHGAHPIEKEGLAYRE